MNSSVRHSKEFNAPEIARPLISLVVPAYNEELLLEKHIGIISDYMRALEDRYRWELLLINDGSHDGTAEIVDRVSAAIDNVRGVHHTYNSGVGRALKTGFALSRGDIVITLDSDLTYSVDHIERLVDALKQSRAKIVLASPYMKDGTVTNVPAMRKFLSIWGNRFLSFFAQGDFSTLTSMVRAYEGEFIRSLDLRLDDLSILTEILRKTNLLGEKVHQISAHLDWSTTKTEAGTRTSSLKLIPHILRTFVSGFMFRPFTFFVLPGLLLFVFAVYVNVWMFIHFFEVVQEQLATSGNIDFTQAVALAYERHTHTFVLGLISVVLATQLIATGFVSLQTKRYYDDLFHLGTNINRKLDVQAGHLKSVNGGQPRYEEVAKGNDPLSSNNVSKKAK